MREKLPYIDLTNFQGLATKATPDLLKDTHLTVAINTDLFESYGGIAKPAGTKRVLATPLMEGASAARISWVGFYKSADLNGQILRHVLIAGGTQLYRVNTTTGTLTQLTGGSAPVGARTANLVHDSDNVEDFLLIQNQDPDLIGKGDFPVKYDGTDIQRWGILAPGSEETVEESFADSTSFTTSGIASIADEATTTRDGAATKITTNASQVNGDLEKTSLNSSPDILITDRQLVYLYIPRGEIENFSITSATPAVQIFIGNDLTANYYRFDFQIGALLEGWNALYLNFANRLNNDTDVTEDDPNVTIVGSPSAPFDSFRWRVNSRAAATQISNLVWDRHVTFDKGAPVVTEDAAASVNNLFCNAGKYSYRITYVSKYGHESNAGPESVMIKTTAARDIIDLTDIPVSTDPQVVARKIYRTVAGGVLHLYVDTIDNNSDTTYEDTTSDVANTVNGKNLGQTSPPFEGDVSDDNAPPPQAGIIKYWKRTVFLAGLPDRPEVVAYSEDDEPESYPTLNEVPLDSKVTGITEAYSGLVIETELGKWQVTGDNPDFQFDKVLNNIGNIGRRALGETRVNCWSTDREGIRLYDLNNPTKISELIRDKFDDEFDKTNLELMQTSHSKSRNAILLLASSSGTFPNVDYKDDNYIYQYPLDQVPAGWWWKLELPSAINPQHFQEIEDSDGTYKLYFGGNDGMLYEVFASGEKNWTLADGTIEAIETEFKSKYIRLAERETGEEGYEGRALPRLFELRYEGDTPCSWHIRVETALGPSQPTATDMSEFYMHFNTNESLLRYPIKVTQPSEYVRFRVRNTQENIAGTVTGVRIYFKAFPGQFPIETGDMVDTTP